MTSAINPNNIDGAYPVAGQDNDSQGFRDNFTNTKTNFQFAANEITELQNRAVLKAALTGSALDNNMNNNLLYNLQLQQFYFTGIEDLDNGAVSNVSATVNYFTTSGAETALLGAGSAGQVKIFCATDVSAGDMVVQVTNPAWVAAATGNITFDGNGQACTLVYANSKWFCAGNNGATFGS